MSTRSRIGIQIGPDILSSYHHWDGYPNWLGRILQTHYNTKEKVSELIDGGDMSCAWTNQSFKDVDGLYQIVDKENDQYGPQYYSERGENCPPVLMSTEEYLTKDNNEEYAYIYRNGRWVCYDMNEFNNSKQPEIVEIPTAPLSH